MMPKPVNFEDVKWHSGSAGHIRKIYKDAARRVEGACTVAV